MLSVQLTMEALPYNGDPRGAATSASLPTGPEIIIGAAICIITTVITAPRDPIQA